MTSTNGLILAKRLTHGSLMMLFLLCLGACGGSSTDHHKVTPQLDHSSLQVKQFDLPSIQASNITTPGETKAYVRVDGKAKLEMLVESNESAAKVTLDSLSTGEHYIEVLFEYNTDEFGTVTIASVTKTIDLEKGSNLLVIEQSDYLISELDDDGDGVSNYAELSLPQSSNPHEWNNFSPVFSTNPNLSYAENSTAPIEVSATDLNGHSLTYAITESVDRGLFSINSTNGELSFLSPPDYEQAQDGNGDNIYELTVEATDEEGARSILVMTIEITDIGPGEQSQSLSFQTGYPEAMYLGEVFSLQAVAQGDGVISFESSDNTIVEVDSEGNLTAQSTGRATITVSIESDNTYQAASTSFTVGVIDQTFRLSAWIGEEGSDVSISYGVDGMEFYRSRDPECDIENYKTCEKGAMDIVDGREILDTAATLEHEGYYTFKWQDDVASTMMELEFPVREGHQVVEFKGKLWIIAGRGPGRESKNDVWSSTDGKHWVRETANAEFSARWSHQVVVYQDKLWLIGGGAGGRSNDVWSSSDGVQWTLMTDSAAFTTRTKHQVVVFQDKLWLIGGSDGERKSDVWSSKDGVNWFQENPAAAFSARVDHQVVVFQDKLWLVGGDDNEAGYKDDVWSSSDGKSWSLVESSGLKFSARMTHQVMVFNNKLWLIGGFDGGWRNDVWSSSDGKSWTLVNDEPAFHDSAYHQTVVFLNRIWVSGGESLHKDDLWSSSDGIEWEKALERPSNHFTPRTSHQVVEFNNKLWLIGGYDRERGRMNDVWSSTDGLHWSLETSNADFSPRDGHQVIVYQNKLWLIGGYSSTYSSDIWSSEDGINWKEETEAAGFSDRNFHQVVQFNNQLWLIGGKSYSTFNNEIWASTDAINWTLVNDSPNFTARAEHQVFEFNGKLWLIGGQVDGSEKNDIWSSEDGVNWTLVKEEAAFPVRDGHRVVVHQDKIWLIGGGTWKATRDIWTSLDGVEWDLESEGTDFASRYHHQAIEYNGVLYLIGGQNNSYKNDVWRFKNSTTWQRAYRETIQFH